MSKKSDITCLIVAILIIALVIGIFSGLLSWIHPNSMVIDGVVFENYGFFNKDNHYNPNVQYKLHWPAAIAGITFTWCLFLPTIYYYGFNLFKPVGKWDQSWDAAKAQQLEGAKFRH